MSLYDKASLVLIPSGTKQQVVFSQKPTNGDGDFDFDRGTTANRINNQGLVESAAIDIPRLDYDGDCPYLLLEEERTNKIKQSENFSDATVWNTGSGSVTIESGYLAPDGTNTAYKITEVSNGVFFTGAGGVLGTDARSIFARTTSGTGQISLTSHNLNTNNSFTVTEEWQRFEVNGTTSGAGASNFYAVDFRGAATNLTEVIIWGAQSEVGDYVTSYIPTVGGSATRDKDLCTNAGNANMFNDNEGVLYAEVASFDDDFGGIISVSDGATNEQNEVRLTLQSGEIKGQICGSSDTTVDLSISTSGVDITSFNKIAFKYSPSVCSLFVNGSKIGDNTTSFSVSSLSKINFSRSSGNSIPFEGKVKSLMYFDQVLTDQECEDLTT